MLGRRTVHQVGTGLNRSQSLGRLPLDSISIFSKRPNRVETWFPRAFGYHRWVGRIANCALGPMRSSLGRVEAP